jgi:hypothetical protein
MRFYSVVASWNLSVGPATAGSPCLRAHRRSCSTRPATTAVVSDGGGEKEQDVAVAAAVCFDHSSQSQLAF